MKNSQTQPGEQKRGVSFWKGPGTLEDMGTSGGERTLWSSALLTGSKYLGSVAPATRPPRHIHTTSDIPQCPILPRDLEGLV